MPKLIENLRAQLLLEAQRQVEERGYARTTIRSVAEACGVAAGTVYNYFPSKQVLIASFMAEDWETCIAEVREQNAAEAKEFLQALCTGLLAFAEKHRTLFSDAEAERTFSAVFPTRHKQLRQQIAALIAPFIRPIEGTEPGFPAEFAAEAVLTWTTGGVPFDRLWPVLLPLVQQKAQGGTPNEQL